MPAALTADLLDELAARWLAIDAPIAHSLEPGLSDRSAGLWGSSERPVTDSIGSLVRRWIEVSAIRRRRFMPHCVCAVVRVLANCETAAAWVASSH